MPEKKYDTPLAKKLGIKPGHRAWFANEPADFREKLVDLPIDVVIAEGMELDVMVLFVTCTKELSRTFDRFRRRLVPGGGLWVAWPKRTSGVETDVTFEIVQPVGLASGLVDNKVCAIDSTWTALRFVHRKKA